MSIMVVNDMLLSARKITSRFFHNVRGLALSDGERSRTRVEGFTLIELLVVIGILGVLAAAALVAINPAEAQKKARDTQRLKDMATIQSIVEQYLNDNPGAFTGVYGTSSVVANANANKCDATGWIGVALGGKSVCSYVNVLPVDPSNRVTATTTNTGTEVLTLAAYYTIQWSGASYKICTHLESKSNALKLKNDGEATVNDFFTVFSSDTISCTAT